MYSDKLVSGIPIGISPGVYIATLVAFVYEVRFLRQLVDIIVATNPAPFHDDMGLVYIAQFDSAASCLPGWQADPALEAFKGNAARYVWNCFRFTIRFVDDLELAANQPIGEEVTASEPEYSRWTYFWYLP